MTNQHRFQETTNCFSADQFREAMGPGYQSALFRDQGPLTGCQPTFARPIPRPNVAALKSASPASERRRFRLRFRVPFGFGRGLMHRVLGGLTSL